MTPSDTLALAGTALGAAALIGMFFGLWLASKYERQERRRKRW